MEENQPHLAHMHSAGQSLDWTSLPGDVRDMIFGTQSLKTLSTLRLVCKSWCAAARNLRCTYGGSETLTGQKLQAICRLIPKCSLLFLRQSTKLTAADLSCASDLRDLRDLHLPGNVTADHITTLCSLQNVVNSLRTLYVTPPSPYHGPGSTQAKEEIPSDVIVALSGLQNLRTLNVRQAPLEETLQVLAHIRHLTALAMTEMIPSRDSTNTTAPIARFISNLSELRVFALFGTRVSLTRAETDALFQLPVLEILRLGQHQPPGHSQLTLIAAPSAEAARLATSLVELDVPYSFHEVLASLNNLKLLTRISILGGGWTHRTTVSCDVLRELARTSPQLVHVSLPMPQCSDDLIEALSRFPKLHRMNVSRGPPAGPPGQVTDEGFQHLTRLQAVQYLSVQWMTSLTASSAEVIGRLASLTDLSLYHSTFTSEALMHLSSLHGLVNLSFDSIPVNDQTLEAVVRSNPRLRRLSALRTKIAAAHYLSCLTSLNTLDLSENPNVDDSVIASLSSLPLQVLTIHGTSVTGVGFAGAKYLTSLSSLSFVTSGFGPPPPGPIRPCTITVEGAQFVAQFPNVRALYLSQPIADSVFYELMSRANYHNFATLGLSAEQVPSLLLCTSLRSLALTDTKNVTEEMLEMICSSLPNLQSFQVRNQNQTKVLKQTAGAYVLSPIYNYYAGGPMMKGPPGPMGRGIGRGGVIPLGPPPAPKPPAAKGPDV